MTRTSDDLLAAEIENRRDDLIALTQDLVRIPTTNPPGDRYREICDYLDAPLTRSGFENESIRATGSPGDSDRHPRGKIVDRRDGAGSVAVGHFTSPSGVA